MVKRVVVGITGGIASYKMANICSKLVQKGYEVRVMMTRSAAEFITPLTFQSLTSQRVMIDMFDHPEAGVSHIEWADWGDCMLIAPATANILGKVRNGIADDFVSTMIMAAAVPVIFAPAMNSNMYANPIVQDNINTLKRLGYHFVDPEAGYLACGYMGQGRLANDHMLLEAVDNILNNVVQAAESSLDLNGKPNGKLQGKLDGKRVLITAGPTREAIDPVRYLSNYSSGKMGYALAEAAREAGAKVTLISGPVDLVAADEIQVIRVNSAEEMLDAALVHLPNQDIIIKAAAVADYRPKVIAAQKIKKHQDGMTIELEKTEDILATISRLKTAEQILVGFAAESENLLGNARKKLLDKQLDMIVANDISQADSGFHVDYNTIVILKRDGTQVSLPKARKQEVAYSILQEIIKINE